MSKRGQALLEFILILPVLIMLLVGFVDYGRITYGKIKLENIMNEVIDLINLDLTSEEIETKLQVNYHQVYKVEIEHKEQEQVIKVTQAFKLFSLGSDLVFPQPFVLKTRRVIYCG